MQRQGEHAPANRHQDIASQIIESVNDLGWQIVNLPPSLIVLAGIDEGEVEWSEAIANFLEMPGISGVSLK